MAMSFKTVYRGGVGEIEEKKSRFIATVRAVETKEEAESFIAAVKKQYPDARHNCSAYILGEDSQIEHSSDDGEPAGTAGKPMLEVLRGEKLTFTAVVVTRYFGGTLLGTGGLVRAYTQAVKAGIENSTLIEKRKGFQAVFHGTYTDVGKIQYFVRQKEYTLMDTVYEAEVKFIVLVDYNEFERFEKGLTENFSGRITIEEKEEVIYGSVDGEAVIFS